MSKNHAAPDFIETKLIITCHQYQGGQMVIKTEGPIENKILCLGLLAIAEKQVHDHVIPEQPIIQPASALDLPRL